MRHYFSLEMLQKCKIKDTNDEKAISVAGSKKWLKIPEY